VNGAFPVRETRRRPVRRASGKARRNFSKAWKNPCRGLPRLGKSAVARGGGTLALAIAAAALAAACDRRPAPPARADSPETLEVRAEVAPERARVGDPLRIELTVEHAAGASLAMPEPADVFEVRRRSVESERLEDGRARTHARYEAICFEVGRHVVFTNAVVQVGADGARVEAPPPAAAIEIVSVLGEALEGPRDIKPPLPWPPPIPRWVWALPLVLLAAALLALAIRAWTRRARRRPAPPPPPPDRAALEALDRLRQRGWIEEDRPEPFYVELSRIVREYVEQRFGLRAPERTTEEFLREAAASNALAPEHQALAGAFLEECDRVKFARARPRPADMRRALEIAERLVRETAANPLERKEAP